MIPANIESEHIIKAIREIDLNRVPPGRESRSFLLIFEGKQYPPKYVLSQANKFANGEKLDPSEFSGGQETNSFLKRLGFDVVEISSLKTIGRSISPQNRTFEMTQKGHDERCPKCKKNIESMLKKIYGHVESDYKFEVSANVEDYRDFPFYKKIKEILLELQKYRGYEDFVRTSTLPRCDFFVSNPGFIVEFDESQDFTLLRKITLKKYPHDIKLGFSRMKWISLCEKINAKDNDPPFRDEQRAWYDALRDLLLLSQGLKPTVRLYAGDFKWCSLNQESEKDLNIFKRFLGNSSPSFVESQQQPTNTFDISTTKREARKSITIALVFPDVWAPTPEKQSKQVCPPNIPKKYKPRIPCKEEFGQYPIDLIVFPEAYIRYEDQERLNLICDLAQQINTHILVGASKRHDNRNSDWEVLLLVQPDRNCKVLYHKHATAGAVAFELPNWNPRKQLPVFNIGEVCMGATICHDSYLGLLQRYLAQRGARIWINPSYDNVIEEKWNSILRLRAVENNFFSLCTLHDNHGRKQRRITHPFGFDPNGQELRGYPPDKPEQTKPLSQCTEKGIYLVECPLGVRQIRQQASLLPCTQKQSYRGNARGYCLEVLLCDGRPHLKSNGRRVWLEHQKPLSVGQVKILPGLIPGNKLFDISEFFKTLIEAHRQGCKPLFWNQWTQLPTDSDKLVDIMLGRTLEMLAPVILSDSRRIYEITEIAGGTKTMRRISIDAAQGSVDVSFALGLPNAFKMTYDSLNDVDHPEKYLKKFLIHYESLLLSGDSSGAN